MAIFVNKYVCIICLNSEWPQNKQTKEMTSSSSSDNTKVAVIIPVPKRIVTTSTFFGSPRKSSAEGTTITYYAVKDSENATPLEQIPHVTVMNGKYVSSAYGVPARKITMPKFYNDVAVGQLHRAGWDVYNYGWPAKEEEN